MSGKKYGRVERDGRKDYRRWGKRWKQGIRDGIQTHSSFHTDVKDLEYKDLLTNTFTLSDHERVLKNWGSKDGYPQYVFCTNRY